MEALALEFFNLHFMFWALRHRNRADDPYDLTEPEFVALDTLAERGLCTVGELQQVLDVRPAQMSRIIRALESKGEKPFISCTINTQDKRRINVNLTEQGKKSRDEYRKRRLVSNMKLVMGLSETEQMEVRKIINRFRQIMSDQLHKSARA